MKKISSLPKNNQHINSLVVQLLIEEFNKNRKIGEKGTFPKSPKYTIITTSNVSIFMKSGKRFESVAGMHYAIMQYPSIEKPIVKIASFINYDHRAYDFPKSIIMIPLESVESVEFAGSGKMGILGYSKNKARI